MQRRTGDAQPKAMIAIAGLKGKPVAQLCPAHQIRQSLSDQWRDQCLAPAAKAFDDPQRTRQEARLAQENVRLKPRVRELTFERKNNAEWLA